MWYVMQVRAGREEEMAARCRKQVDRRELSACFIPYYEEMKQYGGEWHREKKVLFPGYVFMVSDDIESLFLALKRAIGHTRLLKTGNVIAALSAEEVEFLRRIGKEKQVMEMSAGIIESGGIKVLAGPLRGLEGCIRRIDRHKRKAWLEITMFGRIVSVQAGLEITKKT